MRSVKLYCAVRSTTDIGLKRRRKVEKDTFSSHRHSNFESKPAKNIDAARTHTCTSLENSRFYAKLEISVEKRNARYTTVIQR